MTSRQWILLGLQNLAKNREGCAKHVREHWKSNEVDRETELPRDEYAEYLENEALHIRDVIKKVENGERLW